MSYLLDTHIVLWLIYQPNKLNHLIKEVLLDSRHQVYLGAVDNSLHRFIWID